MFRRSKRVTTRFAAFVLVFMLLGTVAFAIQYPNYRVDLYEDANVAYSSSVYGYYKEFAATNYSFSADNVYARAQYYKNGTWTTDWSSAVKVPPGATFDFSRTVYLQYEHSWRLRLSTQYGNGGSRAVGWIWYR